MGFYGFVGGIHPRYNKGLTSDKPVEVLSTNKDDQIFIPLSQHIGAPAKPVVKKNDEVKRGQVIGVPGGFVSSTIHSPVTGTVMGIVKVPHPISGSVDAVQIKVTELDEDYEHISTDKKFQEIVLDAGIVGLGGATFPTHVKLSPPKKIEYLIINGAECEPYLTCDHRLMVEKTEEVLQGAEIIRQNLGEDVKLIIGIEENKPDA
ncbi:MAG: electron transport complex subunit RsxC, partial [Deferribacterales bacterium]|nr:electron transport complex subunit RsxC [Deferribacterales bacterium]